MLRSLTSLLLPGVRWRSASQRLNLNAGVRGTTNSQQLVLNAGGRRVNSQEVNLDTAVDGELILRR